MKMHAAIWLGSVALIFGAGCVSMRPPSQLLAARGAYTRAEVGVAGRYASAELRQAKIALEIAEASFAEEGDAQRTRDLAYVARRRAQLAAVVGETFASKMSRERAVSSLHAEHAERSEHATGATNVAPAPAQADPYESGVEAPTR